MASAAQAQAFDPGAAQAMLRRNQNIARRTSSSAASGFNQIAAANNNNENGEQTVADTQVESDFFHAGQRQDEAYADALHKEQMAKNTYRDTLVLPQNFGPEVREEFDAEQERIALEEEAVRQESQSRSVGQLGGVRGQLNQIADQKMKAVNKAAIEELKRQGNRWIAKFLGHGTTAGDAAGFGLDFFVAGALAFCYDMARGVTMIFMPTEPTAAEIGSPKDLPKIMRNKLLYMLFPPYHPLREAGDFAWFLGEILLATFALTCIVMMIVLIAAVPILIIASVVPISP